MTNTATDVTPHTAQVWAKPELIRLGQIGDVAGSLIVNANGTSVNLKS